MNRSVPLVWQTPETPPALSAHEIHVWHAPSAQACHPEWLSPAERERQSAIRDPARQRQFCAMRCILRHLLGAYIGCEPAKVDIRLEPDGKPYLPAGGVQFNLSHSHGRALLAFALDRRIGVDLEIERPMKNIPQIAQRLFAPDEFAELRRQGFAIGPFLEYWTAYEARQKCLGRGIFGERSVEAGIHTEAVPIEDARACIAWTGSGPPPHLRYFTYPPDAPLSRL